jgi:hypothetical protein
MSFVKYLLPALAATSMVFADDNCGDTTLENQSDADGLGSCSTISGDITIKDTFSGDLALNGIKKIEGSLKGRGGENVTSLSADSLTDIGKNFTLTGFTGLSQLSFGKLGSIGAVYWEALPQLQSLDFGEGVTEIGDVSVINTGLTSLDGFALKTVGDFNIEDNNALKMINLNDLTNATGLINFSGNDNELNIELPNLQGAKGLTFRNVSSVTVPSLESSDGQLGFWGTGLSNFTAMNLTQTGDLIFNDNPYLNNISMPNLTLVDGGFTIKKNKKLDSIDLPELTNVKGAIQFSGTFDELEFGSLDRVNGAFNVVSTHGNFSCPKFDSEIKPKVKGKYNCNAADPKAGSGSSSTSSSDSSSGSSGATSSGAAAATAIPATGIAAIFFALAQLF